MFAIPRRERILFYHVVQGVWTECEISRALSISTLVKFVYMMDEAQLGTVLDLGLIR